MKGKKFLNILITILSISTFSLGTTINNNQHEKFYVINGEDASYDDYPFFARIFWTEKENSEGKDFTGGATLIHPQWVITALHTLERNYQERSLLPWLHFGPNKDNPTKRSTPAYSIKAQKIYRYQDVSFLCTPLTKFVDLALIKLERPIYKIKPMALIKPHQFNVYGKATIIGHGKTTSNVLYSPKLQKTDVVYFTKTIVDMEIVEINDTIKKMVFNPHSDIFAGNLKSKYYQGAAEGDSGGPLFIKTNYDDSYKLIGITKGGDPTYPPNQPDVFVGVSYFYNWIMNKIDNN